MKNKTFVYAVAVGFINTLFGAGGGMIAVPLLKKLGLEQKSAQATTICIILPLTVISCVIYIIKGYVTLSDALPYLVPGVCGSILGVSVFKKLPNKLLKKAFAVFMLWAGIRLITK